MPPLVLFILSCRQRDGLFRQGTEFPFLTNSIPISHSWRSHTAPLSSYSNTTYLPCFIADHALPQSFPLVPLLPPLPHHPWCSPPVFSSFLSLVASPVSFKYHIFDFYQPLHAVLFTRCLKSRTQSLSKRRANHLRFRSNPIAATNRLLVAAAAAASSRRGSLTGRAN